MLPIFALASLIWGASMPVAGITIGPVEIVTGLLIVWNSALFQHVCEVTKSIPVACVESISSELSHFTVCHLLGLLDLLRVQLNLSRDDSVV